CIPEFGDGFGSSGFSVGKFGCGVSLTLKLISSFFIINDGPEHLIEILHSPIASGLYSNQKVPSVRVETCRLSIVESGLINVKNIGAANIL
ncbi:MAG: hypothetical protein R3361_04680, partial [Aequorivita vladivostokensis]|nr:hypothetical protein [Aequorivita vladivostokensis]